MDGLVKLQAITKYLKQGTETAQKPVSMSMHMREIYGNMHTVQTCKFRTQWWFRTPTDTTVLKKNTNVKFCSILFVGSVPSYLHHQSMELFE